MRYLMAQKVMKSGIYCVGDMPSLRRSTFPFAQNHKNFCNQRPHPIPSPRGEMSTYLLLLETGGHKTRPYDFRGTSTRGFVFTPRMSVRLQGNVHTRFCIHAMDVGAAVGAGLVPARKEQGLLLVDLFRKIIKTSVIKDPTPSPPLEGRGDAHRPSVSNFDRRSIFNVAIKRGQTKFT